MSVECGQSVRVENTEQLGVYSSSAWGQRCFCKQCGSTLFWRTADGAMTMVAAQAFANATQKLTGAEVMAAFAPKN